jgi:hypothetical protein
MISKCVRCFGESESFFTYGACTCSGYYVPIKEWGIARQKYVLKRVNIT